MCNLKFINSETNTEILLIENILWLLSKSVNTYIWFKNKIIFYRIGGKFNKNLSKVFVMLID